MSDLKITDKHGREIKIGDYVLVHQDDVTRTAKVVDTFENEPNLTIKEYGFWIDVDFGEGPEGMMTYICEVI